MTRKIADGRRHDRKPFAILLRFGRFDGGVQRKHVCLAGNFLNHGNAVGNHFHRPDDFRHRLFPGAGVFNRGQRHVLRHFGVVRRLADIGRHFLHRGRNFFSGGGLLRRAFRHLLGHDIHVPAAQRDFLCGGFHSDHDIREFGNHRQDLLHHRLKVPLKLDGVGIPQIPLRDERQRLLDLRNWRGKGV